MGERSISHSVRVTTPNGLVYVYPPLPPHNGCLGCSELDPMRNGHRTLFPCPHPEDFNFFERMAAQSAEGAYTPDNFHRSLYPRTVAQSAEEGCTVCAILWAGIVAAVKCKDPSLPAKMVARNDPMWTKLPTFCLNQDRCLTVGLFLVYEGVAIDIEFYTPTGILKISLNLIENFSHLLNPLLLF